MAQLLAINLIPISGQIPRCSIVRQCFNHLPPGPSARLVLRDVEMEHSPPLMSATNTNNSRNVAVATVQKSIDTRSWR